MMKQNIAERKRQAGLLTGLLFLLLLASCKTVPPSSRDAAADRRLGLPQESASRVAPPTLSTTELQKLRSRERHLQREITDPAAEAPSDLPIGV